jgi:hypothetical protein
MIETAKTLANLVPGKTIVLTGAFTPWSMCKSVHGRCFTWSRVLKDRADGFFREIDSGTTYMPVDCTDTNDDASG